MRGGGRGGMNRDERGRKGIKEIGDSMNKSLVSYRVSTVFISVSRNGKSCFHWDGNFVKNTRTKPCLENRVCLGFPLRTPGYPLFLWGFSLSSLGFLLLSFGFPLSLPWFPPSTTWVPSPPGFPPSPPWVSFFFSILGFPFSLPSYSLSPRSFRLLLLRVCT